MESHQLSGYTHCSKGTLLGRNTTCQCSTAHCRLLYVSSFSELPTCANSAPCLCGTVFHPFCPCLPYLNMQKCSMCYGLDLWKKFSCLSSVSKPHSSLFWLQFGKTAACSRNFPADCQLVRLLLGRCSYNLPARFLLFRNVQTKKSSLLALSFWSNQMDKSNQVNE